MQIVEVADAAELDAFLALPDSVYRGDPHYLPTDRQRVQADLQRPAFADRQQVFLARQQNRVIARCVARLSPSLVDKQGRPLGMLGFFEAFEDDRAREILTAGIAWLRDQGVGQIVGPLDGDTWHRYRLNVGPFTRPPFLLEPYNPPYYPRLWERAGFAPLERYYSLVVPDLTLVLPTLAGIDAKVTAAGYRLLPLDTSRFEEELRRFYELSLAIFAGNLFYEPIAWDDFAAMYLPLESLVEPRLVWFALAPDGSDAGFSFALPDLQAAMQAMRGRKNLLAKLRFARARRRIDTMNAKSLGVLAAHRQSGIGGALMYRVYREAVELGLRQANLCLIRAGNPSGRLDGGQSELLREYVLYEHSS